jgi:hypothetical protein
MTMVISIIFQDFYKTLNSTHYTKQFRSITITPTRTPSTMLTLKNTTIEDTGYFECSLMHYTDIVTFVRQYVYVYSWLFSLILDSHLFGAK